MKSTVFRLGELFCGPGGMAIGAHATRPTVNRHTGEEFSISHAWGVDRSKPAIETFRTNLGGINGAEAIHADALAFIKDLSPKYKIDALAFGFPCNSFSSVGEREGINSKHFGTLYQAGIRVLEAYRPKWFIAENVSGISAHDSGEQFRKILQELAAAAGGYEVVANLYKFEEYGVPQARHRYVIVGIRSDLVRRHHLEFRVPAPTHGPGLQPYVTARQALETVTNQTPWGWQATRQSDKVVWRLKFTPPGENAWKLDEIINYSDVDLMRYLADIPWFDKEIRPLNSIQAIREKIEYARLHVTKARMSHIYRRLDPNKPAYTLTGSGGGGTHVYHWSEHRALTNEERAALQTFPKSFAFCGSKEEVRKQIGMAVPTEGAKVIFSAILKTFAGVPYPWVEPSIQMG